MKTNELTTSQILTRAYAAVMGVDVKELRLFDETYEGVAIDYASFNRDEYDLPYHSADYFEAITETGSEGCYIGIFLRNAMKDEYGRDFYGRRRAGTIKTLAEGRAAWKVMGALAGELAYVANYVIPYELDKNHTPHNYFNRT